MCSSDLLRASQIWIASLSASDHPAQLYRPRTGVTSSQPKWSPDGTQLAFVSDRGNHSFISVYDFASKGLTYLDPTVDRDSNPTWSPDGKQIAFIRNTSGGSGGGGGRGGRRAGDPWAIRVAAVSDGAGRQIWRAESGPGSVFHNTESPDALFWAAGDRIVFPWERDGWVHLYSVAEIGRAHV